MWTNQVLSKSGGNPENRFLLDTGILDERETEFYKEVSLGMDDVHAFMALHQMSLYLSRYYWEESDYPVGRV